MGGFGGLPLRLRALQKQQQQADQPQTLRSKEEYDRCLEYLAAVFGASQQHEQPHASTTTGALPLAQGRERNSGALAALSDLLERHTLCRRRPVAL